MVMPAITEPHPHFDETAPDAVQARLTRLFSLINEHPDGFGIALKMQGDEVASIPPSTDEADLIPPDVKTRIPDFIVEYFAHRYDRYVSFDRATEDLIDTEISKLHGSHEERTMRARRFRTFQIYVGRVSVYQHNLEPSAREALPVAG